MNRSVLDVDGSVLLVSQFTLYGDTRRGRRPSFVEAAAPEQAEPLVRRVADELEAAGVPVAQGVFGASMTVELTNDGPVTILLER
jgi:D-tyrosyl-tRNA(Tyr) deacylase